MTIIHLGRTFSHFEDVFCYNSTTVDDYNTSEPPSNYYKVRYYTILYNKSMTPKIKKKMANFNKW
jgi:hypothetical protein